MSDDKSNIDSSIYFFSSYWTILPFPTPEGHQIREVFILRQGQTVHKLQIATFWEIYIYIYKYIPLTCLYIYTYIAYIYMLYINMVYT